jgi:hypothetical protein
MLVLSYPKFQSIAFSGTMIRLSNLAQSTLEDEIKFDLSRSVSLTPFGIVMLTSTISSCLSQGKKCIYTRPRNRTLQKFLREIGFNAFFKLDTDNPMPEMLRTGTVQLKRVFGLDALITETLSEIIDYHVNLSPGLKGSLRMSLQETMTNVIDHSEVQDYLVCAWTYPRIKKGQIRLCIADMGMGILQSLRQSGKYAALINDHEAIMLATEPGVSSRTSVAGLGLSHIKNFIEVNEGRMCIISYNGKVFWKYDQGKILKQKMSLPFNGTLVKLVINADKEAFYFLSDEEDYLF